MAINIWLRWSCPECGAPSGDDCDAQCPSGLAVLGEQIEVFLDESERHPEEIAARSEVCHTDAASAAADWCYCQGTAGRAVA